MPAKFRTSKSSPATTTTEQAKPKTSRVSLWVNDNPDFSSVASGFAELTEELLQEILAQGVDPKTGTYRLRITVYDNQYKEEGDRKPNYSGTIKTIEAE